MTVYLSPARFAEYGLSCAPDEGVAKRATALVDAYLRRPEGLVWKPDANGLPCYYSALKPKYSLALSSGIAPGSNVVAQVNGAAAMLQPGDVLIADRGNRATTEAVTVGAVSGSAVTFAEVGFPHASGTLLDAGLVLEEQRYVPNGRPLVIMSRAPLLRIISGVGRYGYGRRGDGANYNMEQFNLLAAVSKFGGPPAWERFSPVNTGWDAETAQVWIPAGVMLAYYSEVKLRYVAGFSEDSLPDPVRAACAQLIAALSVDPGMGNFKSFQAGDHKLEAFSASLLSEDSKRSLDPYVARVFA